MSEPVYVVKCNSGSHDDWHWWISGIYTNPALAIELKDKILAGIAADKDETFPIEGVTMGEHDIPQNLTDEQWKIWVDWEERRETAEEFNGCEVVEVATNKQIR